MDKKIVKNISFHFHPNGFDENQHTIEKADNAGRKRRYLCGISSGLAVDAHGERMSEKCIKSMLDQGNSGSVLLFPDIHGIKESEDIGFLSKAEIVDGGDWYTEYGLYDEGDDIGQTTLDKINKLWKQINGFPPYRLKKQKGFSIEGIIPDKAIVMNANTGQADRSVIDDILLDGVVLVPRPAYTDSMATAIYKALGEVTPERTLSIQNIIRTNLVQEEINDNYRQVKWKYQDALEEMIEQIMSRNKTMNKRAELIVLFDEYKELMINLVINSEGAFAAQSLPPLPDVESPADAAQIDE